MKKYLILLMFCLSFLSLHSQDREPNAWKFRWGFSNEPRVFEPDSVKQESILSGFQWAESLNMNNALLHNSFAGHGYWHEVAQGSRVYPLNMINQPMFWDSAYNPGFWRSPYMNYEPTLPLTETNFGEILRPADNSDPVFGFLYRNGTILTDSTDENYS